MSCRSPRAAERIGKTSSPAASPATAARADVLPSRPACISSASRSDPTRRPRSASRSGCATRPSPGATISTGTSNSTPTRVNRAARERAQRCEPRERSAPAKRRARERVGESEGRSPSDEKMGRLTAVRPLWAIEGGRVTLEGDGFPVDPGVPHVRLAAQAARVSAASPSSLTVLVPEGLEGGSTAIRIDELPGETAFVEVGAPLVTGVHHVDSPAYDRHGNLYVTFSGSRGQQAPVAIFVVRPDGTREPFVTDLANPTSLAFDREGRLYVSSRFDGSVYRVEADGKAALHASDLGVACRLAFGPDEPPYLRDRSGSILRVEEEGRARVFATLPPSVAAFHLAFGPDGHLYVTAPTLGTHDPVYRVTPDGEASAWSAGFGRPQGLAFDASGNLFVVDTLAGSSGLYRIRPDAPHAPELMLFGGPLIGLAFDPHGGIALAASEVVYRLAVPLRGLLPSA